MTSLFFIMLTLFILVIVLLHKQMVRMEEEYRATEEQLEEIKKVEASTKELGNTKYFAYKPTYKKYVLNVQCSFNTDKYELKDLKANTKDLEKAGLEIKEFLHRNSAYQYLLIIEGQASRDNDKLTTHNYELSFRRAFTLMKFWKDVCHIPFGANCEIQIAASGDGRYNFGYTKDSCQFNKLDGTLMREKNEKKNQRFVIHIIPKNIIEDAEK